MLDPILAAGVVLVRNTLGGEPEVLLIHRPRYDDWSIPKGKDDPGETAEEAALRELHEETGHRAVLIDRLGDHRYDVNGRPKLVRYFLGRPVGFDGLPVQDEVDAIEWAPLSRAKELLTYPRDRELLDDERVRAALSTGTVHLIRHAHAGSRSRWEGDDRLRPLTERGRRQAESIAERLAGHGLDVIRSSPYLRCVETVEPLSRTTGIEVEESGHLAEGADASSTVDLIAAASGVRAAFCSHGDVIPEIIELLRARGAAIESPGRLRFAKGSVWEISVVNGTATTARYVPAVP